MTIPLFLILASVQTKDFHWMDANPKPKISPEWNEIKVQTGDKISDLRKLSKAARLSKLENQSKAAFNNFQTKSSEIYFLSTALVEFYLELFNTPTLNNIEQILWRRPGTDDPEFMRIAYAALCRNQAPGRWGLLGVKLRKTFPEDLLTKQSYVKDCIFGKLPLNYCYEGRSLLYGELKSGYSEYGFTDLSANLEMSLYFKTKRKIHLDASIQLLNKIIPLQKKRGEDTRGSDAWLRRLQSSLGKKEYVDD
ncbi:MAG: hypothetical protein ACKVQS_02195 [Fimbriimonadaceae bacterium]